MLRRSLHPAAGPGADTPGTGTKGRHPDDRDNVIVGPGAQEINAQNTIGDGRVDEAQVHAILALASAVNRLAFGAEAIADTQS